MTRFLDAPDPERARRDLDAYLTGHRLAAVLAAEAYAQALYEDDRDGPQWSGQQDARVVAGAKSRPSPMRPDRAPCSRW